VIQFWRDARVAEDLRHDRVSEGEKVIYLLTSLALQMITPCRGLVFRGQTPLGAIMAIAVLAVAIWGTHRAFAINQRGDGARFIERYVVLGLPITLQTFVRFGIVGLILYFLMAPRTMPGTMGEYIIAWGGWLLNVIGMLWFYRRLGQRIAHAARVPGFDSPPG
jgi:hypothetical protein